VHRGTPTPMRAPHEGLSSFGLECTMDELAVQLGVDPVTLRLNNYAETDPTSGKPFSSKALRACYVQGMEQFGWAQRTPAPGSMRDGRDLVGWGMASAIMSTFRFPAAARVTLEKGGTVLIEVGTQEIGTGVYTIMPQIAADVLGLPVERVRLVLGDTTLPEAGGTFGSSTTMGVGSAVYDAATKLKARLTQLMGGKAPDSPAAYDEILAQHILDRLSAESAWSPGTPVERIGLDAGVRALAAEGSWSPGANASALGEVPDWSMHTFGAVFAEVRVDQDLRIPRLSRCVGVYSAGRIINPKTARSQIIGGMIWGLGQALLEHSAMDHTLGRYLSKNLSGYLVPVNADVPGLEVSFVDEVDTHASALGAKGIGELGAVGVGPAIANAVWHATGIRVRELPILPETLL
jgi:xanthine dehydrogenase YagR molybdenum-binding subunit